MKSDEYNIMFNNVTLSFNGKKLDHIFKSYFICFPEIKREL